MGRALDNAMLNVGLKDVAKGTKCFLFLFLFLFLFFFLVGL